MNVVIILAGGKGSRFNGKLPKQHIKVKEHQIIEYTLTAFSSSPMVDKILIVSNADYVNLCEELSKTYKKIEWIISGGDTRILSVYNAINFLSRVCNKDDKIVISDAARPCIKLSEIEKVFQCLDKYCGVTTGVEVYETILRIEEQDLKEIIPREGIFRQTSPEGYRYYVLDSLYNKESIEKIKLYKNIGIDQLFEQGKEIGIVHSSPLNFKITTNEDISLFENVLKQGFLNFICEDKML